MSEWELVPCWNCNSPQEFRPRTRKLEDGTNESYIKCQMCRKEKVLDVLSDVQLARKRRQARAKKRKKK